MKFSYGGQALIEGVMMCGREHIAMAVRKGDGTISCEIEKRKSISDRFKFLKWPFVRGTVNLVESLVLGFKALTYSANESAESEEEELSAGEMAFSVVLALVLGIGLFFLLPAGLAHFTKAYVTSSFMQNLLEGAIRVAIFIGYIVAISKMSEIARVFQYHGAEHKTIHAYEAGVELIPANCRQFPTLHPRCGTSFLMFVFIIAFALHFLLGWPTLWLRIVTRLLLLPVIAGLSYELLKWAGKSDNIVVKILSLPGLYLQKITTKEPDDSQLEVAIAAIHAVCDEKPCGTYTICKEDVGHYDGHELIESAKEDGDDDRTEKPQGIFVKYRPLQKRRFL